MKKIILTIISMTAALSPAAGHASGLVPVGCSLRNNGHVYTFLMEDYDFDCNIGVIDNSVATVYCEGQPVATGNFWVGNAHGQNPSGYVRIFFDPFLSPPKGKTYSLVVPAGVIYKEDDPTVTNDELSVDFYVPEVLGFRRCSMQNSSVVDLEACIGFYYETGTARAENGEIILYRKDVPIKKDPVRAGYNYDSGLGYAEMSFGGGVHFESGVEYTVRLPQGSLTAEFRSDITNEEVSVSFTGGSTVPFGPLMYNGCSLSDSQPSDMLGEVKFYYENRCRFGYE